MPTRRRRGGWVRHTDNIFVAQKVLRECIAPMHFKLVEARPSLIALHITYRDGKKNVLRNFHIHTISSGLRSSPFFLDCQDGH